MLMQHPGLDSCIVTEKIVKLSCTIRWLLHVLFQAIIWAGYSNIFTSVCQEFCSQGEGVHLVLEGGCLVPGGPPPGVCLVETPPHDGYCCGRYASSWNAFLLSQKFRNLKSPLVGPTWSLGEIRGDNLTAWKTDELYTKLWHVWVNIEFKKVKT